jgi:hypothetical protein
MQVWGGVRAYAGIHTKSILAAVRDFTEYYPDPNAAIIATADIAGYNLIDGWVVFFFYNGPKPPPTVFANFTRIPHILDLTAERSFHDMLLFDNNFVVRNSIYTIGTETAPLPNSTVGTQVMQGFYDSWHSEATKIPWIPGLVASLALQPLPKSIGRISKEKGPSVLEFDDEVDRIVFELDYSYWYETDDITVNRAMESTYKGLRAKTQEYIKGGLLPKAHLPLFMNDAFFMQDYWGRVNGASVHRATAAKYDPKQFWKSRTKGFHIQ